MCAEKAGDVCVVCVCVMCVCACTSLHVCVCVYLCNCGCVVLKREVCSTKEWRGPTERWIRLQLDGSERRNMVPHVLRKSSPSVHGDKPPHPPPHHPPPPSPPPFAFPLSFSSSPSLALLFPLSLLPLVHCWQKQGQSRGDGMNAGPRATADLVHTHTHTHAHWRKITKKVIKDCSWCICS